MQDVYARLKAAWEAGERDREHALQLLFLSWMHWADPPHLTGLLGDPDDARSLWRAIFDHFRGEAATDPEFLYVAGLMAGLFPWELGEHELWEGRAERMSSRAGELKPYGFMPDAFEGRGDYGEYFAHQARRR